MAGRSRPHRGSRCIVGQRGPYLGGPYLDEETAALVGDLEDLGPGEAVDPKLVLKHHQAPGGHAQHDVNPVQVLRRQTDGRRERERERERESIPGETEREREREREERDGEGGRDREHSGERRRARENFQERQRATEAGSSRPARCYSNPCFDVSRLTSFRLTSECPL